MLAPGSEPLQGRAGWRRSGVIHDPGRLRKGLQGKAAAVADQLAASAPIALAGILDTILEGGECAIDQGLDYEAQTFANCFSTDDMREGTKAFMERRKASFRGR